MQLLSGPTFQAGRSVCLGLYIKKETWVVAESAVWLQSCIIVMYGDSVLVLVMVVASTCLTATLTIHVPPRLPSRLHPILEA